MKRPEYIGLGIATIGHVGLFGVLSLSVLNTADSFERSEPIAVTLSDTIALADTSPTPDAVAATSIAPELGEIVPPPEELAQPEAAEQSIEIPPQPSPARNAAPKASAAAKVAPKPKPKAKKPPKPVDRSGRRRPDRRRTGSRLGNNFLDGVSDQESLSRDANPPAAKAGPQVTRSIKRAIAGQLKPFWEKPSGPEADKLTTKVKWALNKSGNLVGTPKCIAQGGVTATNRAQKDLHCERAKRAIRRAAPFTGLPAEYYETQWANPTFTFNWKT